MRNNAAEGLLSSAAMETVRLLGSPEVLVSTRFVLDQVGQVLTSTIRPGERVSLFVPGHVAHRNHWFPGALALVGERLLTAWSAGRYRPRRRVVTIRRRHLRPVTMTRRGVEELRIAPVCLTIGTWRGTLVFALPAFGADEVLARYVGEVLDEFRLGLR